MTFKKGDIKPPNSGKKKGTENKVTRDIKEAYRMLIEANLDNLTIWLQMVAKKNPEKAIYILSELSEYVLPKQARVNHVSEDGTMSPKPAIEVTSNEAKKELEKIVNG